MRPNPLRAAIQRGDVLIGTWLVALRTPAILALLRSAGLDFVRIDMEHGGFTIETVADMAVLARNLDLGLVVRPPIANREWITQLLDIGVWNLHCPQVDTPEHAAEIVAASRYSPMGLRGMGPRGTATDFDRAGTPEARAFANREVFITVMLESRKAFENLDPIAAMPGIDALTLGPHDLCQDLGVLDTPDHDKVLDEKRRELITAAHKYGKVTTMLAADVAQSKKLRAAGIQMIAYANEVEVLHGAFSGIVSAIRDPQQKPTTGP